MTRIFFVNNSKQFKKKCQCQFYVNCVNCVKLKKVFFTYFNLSMFYVKVFRGNTVTTVKCKGFLRNFRFYLVRDKNKATLRKPPEHRKSPAKNYIICYLEQNFSIVTFQAHSWFLLSNWPSWKRFENSKREPSMNWGLSDISSSFDCVWNRLSFALRVSSSSFFAPILPISCLLTWDYFYITESFFQYHANHCISWTLCTYLSSKIS